MSESYERKMECAVMNATMKESGVRGTGGNITNPADIPALERDIKNGEWEHAEQRVIALIEVLGSDGADVDLGTDDEKVVRAIFGQVVRAITTLISAPEFVPSVDFYRTLALRKRVLVDLFAASDLENMDVMLRSVFADLEERNEWGRGALMKVLLSYSLESDTELDPGDYLTHAPELVVDACIGLLASNVVLTTTSEKGRRKVSRLAERLIEYPVSFDALRYLAQGWFRCSYDDREDKHDVKRHLNSIFRKTFADIGVTDLAMPSDRRRPQRPTMVVPLERFTSTHAVFRCWAPAIRQLRERFRLVAVCEPQRIDSRSAGLFDEVVTHGFDESEMAKCVREIEAREPDVVYYPSVGMSTSVIALANLRLAPVQAMTVGHPATSNSAVMDYIVVEEPWLGDPHLFSETIVLLSDGGFQAEARHDAVPVKPSIRDVADPVRVAVSGTFFKLNPRFLDVCRQISERSSRSVEFHFFPSTLGPRHHHVGRRIRDLVQGAIVHSSTTYNQYVRQLNSCDVQLVPFPFGNTNSSLDGFRQGMPVVTLDGSEVHSRIDGAMLLALGMPEWIVASDEDEFIAAALRLIENDQERVAVSRAMLASELDRRFFDSEMEHHSKDFGALFWWLYECHEEIVRDGRKVWRPEERNVLARSAP